MSIFKLRNPKIEDAGNKIGGARKDFYGDYSSAIIGMSDKEILKETTKPKIWGKIAWDKLVTEHKFDAYNTYVAKYIYDNLCTSVGKVFQGVVALRENCIKFVNIHLEIKEALLEFAAGDDHNVQEWFRNFLVNNGYVNEAGVKSHTKHPSNFVMPDSLMCDVIGWSNDMELRTKFKMYLDGFPNDWKEVKLNNFYVSTRRVGGALKVRITCEKKGKKGLRGVEIIVDKGVNVYDFVINHDDFKTLETYIKSDTAEPTKRSEARKSEYIIRPQYAFLERHGPVCRDRDITGEDFIETFKFWGVEYGNWLTGKDRQSTLNYAWEALHDLMYVLNYPKEAVSLSVPSYQCKTIIEMGIPAKELNTVLNFNYTNEMREADEKHGLSFNFKTNWSFAHSCIRTPNSPEVQRVLEYLDLQFDKLTEECIIETVYDAYMRRVVQNVGISGLNVIYPLIAEEVKLQVEEIPKHLIDTYIEKDIKIDERGNFIYESDLHERVMQVVGTYLKTHLMGYTTMLDCLLRYKCDSIITYANRTWLERVGLKGMYKQGVARNFTYASFLSTAYTRPLSLAFGARGVKRAAAHFEPDRNVINLTKKNGAGSLAHEWGHAFDYAVGRVIGFTQQGAKTAFTKTLLPSGTLLLYKWNETQVKGDYLTGEEYFELYPEVIKNVINPDIRNFLASVYDLFFAIFGTYRYGNAEDAYMECMLKRCDVAGTIRRKFLNSLPSDWITPIRGSFIICREAINDEVVYNQVSEVYRLILKLFSRNIEESWEAALKIINSVDNCDNPYMSTKYLCKSVVVMLERTGYQVIYNETCKTWKFWNTNYITNAKALDGYAGQPYYQTPVELFARAFESYVNDAMGYDTDYLVHSVTNGSYSVCTRYYDDVGTPGERSFSVGRGVSPYPEGTERKRINECMSVVVAKAKKLLYGDSSFEDYDTFKISIQSKLPDTYSAIHQVSSNYLGVKSTEQLTPCFTEDGELFCFTDKNGIYYDGELEIIELEYEAIDVLFSEHGEILYSREADYEEEVGYEDDDSETYEEDASEVYDEVDSDVEEEGDFDSYVEEADSEDEYDEEYDPDALYDESEDFDADSVDDVPAVDYEAIARRVLLYCQVNGYPNEDMPKYIDMLVYNTPNDIPELAILLEQKAAMDEEEALYKEFVEVTSETKRLEGVSVEDVNAIERQINGLLKPTFADVVNVEAKIAASVKALSAMCEACENNLYNVERADLTSQHRELITSDVSGCQARLENAKIKLDDCRRRIRAIRDELQALQVDKRDNSIDVANNGGENKPVLNDKEIFRKLLGNSPLSGGV